MARRTEYNAGEPTPGSEGNARSKPEAVGVIFFVTSLAAGGAERSLASQIRKLSEAHRVSAIVCLRWTADLRIKRELAATCPIIELLGHPGRGRIEQFVVALRMTWRHRHSLFQGWMYHGCVLATGFWWLLGSGRRLLWSIHSSGEIPDRNGWLHGLKLRGMGLMSRVSRATIIFCGDRSRVMHVQRWKWPDDNVRVLTNGIDVGRFAPSVQVRASCREVHGISREMLVLGYVGRWHPDKDVGNLCRALKLWPSSNSRLVVIFCGSGLDHRNSQFVQAIAGLGGNVRCVCLGEVSDTSQVMPAFDFLCLSSLREAYPLVLCEALACGVPCVATDVGDCSSIIGEFGLIVPPGDSDRMGRAFGEYAEVLRSGRVEAIRAGARAWAVNAFDEAVVARRYSGMLEAQWILDRELTGRRSMV